MEFSKDGASFNVNIYVTSVGEYILFVVKTMDVVTVEQCGDVRAMDTSLELIDGGKHYGTIFCREFLLCVLS